MDTAATAALSAAQAKEMDPLLNMNRSQLAGVATGLSHTVSLVQGPPGTGVCVCECVCMYACAIFVCVIESVCVCVCSCVHVCASIFLSTFEWCAHVLMCVEVCVCLYVHLCALCVVCGNLAMVCRVTDGLSVTGLSHASFLRRHMVCILAQSRC
jgi:hypothetical protein